MTDATLTGEEREYLEELVAHGPRTVIDTRIFAGDHEDAQELHRAFVVLHTLAERGWLRAEVCTPGSLEAYIGWELTEAGRAAL